MPQTVVDISNCLPPEPAMLERIRIRINGFDYNIWAEWNGAIWVTSMTVLSGANPCDITACMPSNPSTTMTYVINGAMYHYLAKWRCGAA